jgi:pimeloyl-ACP methyl ester carboxylesterase
MQLALDYPDRTAGLVLIGTASECNAKARTFYEDLGALADERGMEPVHRRLGVDADQAPTHAATFAHVARAIATLHEEPLTPRLAAITCPTLVVVGEKDFLGVGGSVIIHRGITRSRLAIVPERGHGIFQEDPPQFNALIEKYLASIIPMLGPPLGGPRRRIALVANTGAPRRAPTFGRLRRRGPGCGHRVAGRRRRRGLLR